MSLPEYLSSINHFLTTRGFSSAVEAAVILGSGLGDFSDLIQDPVTVSYSEIPDFPHTSVKGHSGELISGTIANKNVIAFSGRFHRYEGHSYSKTVLPVHLAKSFGAQKLIISNAAGAINTGFKVGDLMVIDDVFRLFEHVSAAPSEPFRYNHGPTATRVREIAASIGLEVQRGTYLFAHGPSYETKSEIRAFRTLGGDVVGMSTLPELVEAARLELPTAAISMVTNMAAGVVAGKLDHSHVKAAAESRKDDFARLVTELIKSL